MLGVGFRLGLLLRLSSLRGCLFLSSLLGLLLLAPAAHSAGSCTNGGTSTSIPSDGADGRSPGCTFSGTLYRPSLGCCCGRLFRSLLLSSFLLLRARCCGWRSLRINAGLLLGGAVAIVLVFELLLSTLLVLWISK